MPRFPRPLHAAPRPVVRGLALALLCVGVMAPGRSAEIAASGAGCDCAASAPRLGIDVLLEQRLDLLRGKRVGLVTNATGVDGQLRSSVDRLSAHPGFTLVALFGPEHGVRGDVQAGDKVASSRDAVTDLPVHSLYGEHREPTAAMLAGIDVLVFDIQDVGTRFYTYPYTLAGVMRAAKRAGIPVVVTDRPDPMGGVRVEGPVLEPALASFVGMFPIPLRHGMTLGELASLFNAEFGIGAELHVVTMQGWRRGEEPLRGALPWVPPSPNMPTPDTALVYPGTGLLEGTNVSEGRGTTRPFETLGAPWVDARALADRLNAMQLPGVRFRTTWFTPSFSKHAGQACAGVQLHVTDRATFRPVRTGIAVLKALHDQHPKDFAFLPGDPPFFDRLSGVPWLRGAIARGDGIDAIEARWAPALEQFRAVRQRYLLYPERGQ
ncbi:DUF1343 domain-containing protein [Pseudoxanthomonas sp.]|uniref:exo-beta-N-acetylmuramidase NamZ family protein n=1 Tax=Pseudoxanthomonas sp. TaxID=1871049 RepID=UPI002FE16024